MAKNVTTFKAADLKIPTAILLGGNKLNVGVFDKFRAAGLRVIVVDWSATPELEGNQHIRRDVKDTRGVLAALEQHRRKAG
jgi:hypothetical protein